MAREQAPTTVDFETQPIENRPDYPPKSAGVAIHEPGSDPVYAAWGHPENNGIYRLKKVGRKFVAVQIMKSADPKRYGREKVREAYKGTVLHHHEKFDCDVAETEFKIKLPPWEKRHDTLYQLFLHNPHSRSLSLKPASEEILKIKQDDQEQIRKWLVEHKVVRSNDKKWAAHIGKLPGDMAAIRGVGDVVRTRALHEHLFEKTVQSDEGMRRSYDRERRLMPILLANEREGMRVNLKALRRDIDKYQRAQKKADDWIRRKLRSENLNVSSDEDLADALQRARYVTKWKRTAPSKTHPTGQRSVSKKNLTVEMFSDARRRRDPRDGEVKWISEMYSTLGYRNRLQTCLSTFMLPWLEQAERCGGYIHTNWNQVRQAHGDDNLGGSRTSRLSSNPNFLNVPKDWYDKHDGYVHPYHLDVPELPMMRSYILPDEGDEFLHVDWSQQEYRLIAHYEDGALCAQYNENPFLDFHQLIHDMIHDHSGKDLQRRILKICNFLDAYGGGLGKLALMVGCSIQEARAIRASKRAATPDVRAFEQEVKYLAATGQAIRTWGGSKIFCEPPRMVKNDETGKWEWRTFEYKMVNYLIQRSAAEMMKEAIIAYHHHPKRKGRWLVGVHDENNASARNAKTEAPILVECMMGQKCDVPMITGDYDVKKRIHYPADAGSDWGHMKHLQFNVGI